jgi:CheY-like chemotaxis protein
VPLATQTRTVLVVDDDPGIRQIVSWALEDEGYAVQTATNGRDALEAVRRQSPDAIVLDLNMPVMDGWSFIHAHQADPTCRDVPIILMSAGQSIAHATGLGAAAFVTKPLDVEVLVGTVASVL